MNKKFLRIILGMVSMFMAISVFPMTARADAGIPTYDTITITTDMSDCMPVVGKALTFPEVKTISPSLVYCNAGSFGWMKEDSSGTYHANNKSYVQYFNNNFEEGNYIFHYSLYIYIHLNADLPQTLRQLLMV